MSLIQDLVTENPMLVEVQRFARRFSSFRRGPVNGAILVLAMCGYGFLWLCIASMPGFEPSAVVCIQLVIYCFLVPSMTQGCIAGEREKGTWETLLSTPVTRAQIVAGKYISASLAVLGIAFLMSLPLVWTTYSDPLIPTTYHTVKTIPFGDLVLAETIATSFGLCLAAWCVLISARSKRAFAAQGAIYGTILFALLVWPAMTEALSTGAQGVVDDLNFLHPFMLVTYALDGAHRTQAGTKAVQDALGGWLPVLLYLLLAAILVVWAERTLRFVDANVRFIPRRRRA